MSGSYSIRTTSYGIYLALTSAQNASRKYVKCVEYKHVTQLKYPHPVEFNYSSKCYYVHLVSLCELASLSPSQTSEGQTSKSQKSQNFLLLGGVGEA